MALRKVSSPLFALLVMSTFGVAAAGCDDKKKDDSKEEEEEDDDKKEKKKKKKKKKDDDGEAKGSAEPTKAEPKKEEPVLPTKIVTEPPVIDEATKTKAKDLVGKIEYGRFPYELTKDKANAKAWVHLAASSTEAHVTTAALFAMASAYTSFEKSEERTLADEDYARAVLMKIQDPDGKIQSAALRAAQHPIALDTPHPKVMAAVIDLAANHPKQEGKHAALESLGSLTDLVKNDAAMTALFKAFEAPEPWLVSEAVYQLKFRLFDVKDREPIKAKLLPLLKHADPGVRGYATEALARLAGWEESAKKAYVPLVTPMLDDAHPFVKSSAFEALAYLESKPSFHKIITFVEDTTTNTHVIKGWTRLDGDDGSQHHSASAWSTLGDAALSAIRSISAETSTKFEYKIEYKTKEADLKKAAGEAKVWYEKVKGELGSA